LSATKRNNEAKSAVSLNEDDVKSKVSAEEWEVRVNLSCIHTARDDARCVLHVHSLNGTAVSAQRHGILPISQKATFVLASLSYHDYEGVALNPEEQPRLVRALGRSKYLMLRNHGLLTVGATVADAFFLMYQFEAACTIQVRAQAGGGELVSIDQSIRDGAPASSRRVTLGQGASLVWPGLLRRLNRVNPGYAE
jgi:ribulose-5-phosphate 4-epimerase/fuculose-1-phosphate aldolase